MLLHMRKEFLSNNDYQEYQGSKIDNLILIDRTIDPITPLMTQLTYEGLIDENFSIKYSMYQLSKVEVKYLIQKYIIMKIETIFLKRVFKRNYGTINY